MSDFLNFFCCTRIKDFISSTSHQKPEILIPPPVTSEQISQKSSQSLIKTLLEQRFSQQKKPIECQIPEQTPPKPHKKPYLRLWTSEEDSLLQSLYKKYGGKWDLIAKKMGKTANQVSHRWRKIKPPEMKKRHLWAKEEDQKLVNLVEIHGKNWNLLINLMPGRNRKQIRDRYNNILDPKLKKEQWTPQEDRRILELFQQFGPKWAYIAGFLDGRSEIMVKNRFNNHLKHKNLASCEETDIQRENSEQETASLKKKDVAPANLQQKNGLSKYLGELNSLLNPNSLSLYGTQVENVELFKPRNTEISGKSSEKPAKDEKEWISFYPRRMKYFSSGSETMNKSPHLYESEKSVLNSLKNINLHDEKPSENEKRNNMSFEYCAVSQQSGAN